MDVAIGNDPHKASHTAVALGDGEVELDRVEVRSGRNQLTRLMAWAGPFPQRRWAIEGAGGLGFLLAQPLVSADQAVVDVPATLAARTRLLGNGRTNKNDSNDLSALTESGAFCSPKVARACRSSHGLRWRLSAAQSSERHGVALHLRPARQKADWATSLVARHDRPGR